MREQMQGLMLLKSIFNALPFFATIIFFILNIHAFTIFEIIFYTVIVVIFFKAVFNMMLTMLVYLDIFKEDKPYNAKYDLDNLEFEDLSKFEENPTTSQGS